MITPKSIKKIGFEMQHEYKYANGDAGTFYYKRKKKEGITTNISVDFDTENNLKAVYKSRLIFRKHEININSIEDLKQLF